MKKKIGYVMAYKPGHNNYGTSLQGYALLKTLEKLGYDVQIINYIKKFTIIQKAKWVINAIRCGEGKELLLRFRNKRSLSINTLLAHQIRIRTECVDTYKRRKLLPYFKNYVGYDSLHDGSDEYDAIIVGSDQVWTPMGLPSKYYNLLFVKDSVKKIAYASSFGVPFIPKFQANATSRYLNRFDKIGVREIRGKEIVDSLSDRKASLVADPTLLLSKEEWEKELEVVLSESSRSNSIIAKEHSFIFCYFLGNNIESRKAAFELKEQTGLEIITIRHMDEFVESDELFGDYAPYDVNPNDFIQYIKNAEYILTDSFHCTVFSILFKRRFLTFYRFSNSSKVGRNSRIDSLFETLSIPKSHIFINNIKYIYQDINWDLVETQLDKLRCSSIEFIKQAIEE